MLIKEHWGIENAPFWHFFHAHYKNAISVIIFNFCDRDSWEHALNCSQYFVSHTNKLLQFYLDRKLNSWLKFQPNSQHGYHAQDYSLSAIFVFPQAKFMISWLQWLEKKIGGAHARWCAIAIFQLTELNIKANPPCFQHARARGRAKWRRELCAERMRSANVRNDLNCYKHSFFVRNVKLWNELPRDIVDNFHHFKSKLN